MGIRILYLPLLLFVVELGQLELVFEELILV
jgi:hypothetical protein